MADKAEKSGAMAQDPGNTLEHLQQAGLGDMMGMGRAWADAVGQMNAEVAEFVAMRIKEDIKTQREIMQCRDMGELQKIQADFMKKAVDQYQAETGKLVEMSTRAFAPKTDKS